MSKRTCSIDGCSSPALARGWCSTHYHRWQRHGDPGIVKKIQGDDVARFRAHIATGAPEACWPWLSYIDELGYGQFRVGGRMIRAHRYAYMLDRGPIPTGLVVDHLCHTGNCPEIPCLHRRCCNPAHLALATIAENVRRTASRQSMHSGF